NNLLEADMVVSTNYINVNGFDPTQGTNLFNVNFDHRVNNGGSLSLNDLQQNIANLLYYPRPPVFVNTNTPGQPEGLEFRFYLDLNRNRRFETNGIWPEIDNLGNLTGKDVPLVGDPEWIGVLENPDFPHSRKNRFVGRYAFIALPIGKSLDINFIHNNAKAGFNDLQNGFFLNQRYGSWELNLAAILLDL